MLRLLKLQKNKKLWFTKTIFNKNLNLNYYYSSTHLFSSSSSTNSQTTNNNTNNQQTNNNQPITIKRKQWNPNEIFPNKEGEIRICGITLRDGHQSLNGGLHRIDLLTKASKLINNIRPSSMQYPGCEEIGGGTTVDFPLRFKGENPFKNMCKISNNLTHTPTSCLIRSDSLCGYNINPPDVVDAFITRYAECGLDIFRVFDAYNNIENQLQCSKAIIKNKKHYQAAITFTSHSDETIFNPSWVAEMSENFANLGAHSICIKDMAGISSPKLMYQWVSAIKSAVPHLPIHIHCHYTTGFSPIVYLEAIKAGASAIDCGISTLSGRSGHPAIEVFNQVLYDMGYNLGWDYKLALQHMQEVSNLYREYHGRYEFSEMKMAGTVDYRVFTQGIPGGQISIMRNELIRNGYGHLFDNVIEQIQRVREQCGGVALVTPTSEHVARQSIVNAMNEQNETTEKSPLWPGYSEMLRGVMGRPPLKCNENLQKRALKEYTKDIINKELKNKYEKDKNKDIIINSIKVDEIVEYMWKFSEPVRNLRDLKDLESRIRQLSKLNNDNNNNKKYEKEINESKKKYDNLINNKDGQQQQQYHIANEKEDNEYTEILKCKPNNNTYNKLLKDLNNFGINEKFLNKEDILLIIKSSSFCTVCPSTILEPAMERSRLEVEKLAVEKGGFYPPQRGTVEFEEYAILQCMFKHAQNIALFWFQNNEKNPSFWDKHFPKDFPFDRDINEEQNIIKKTNSSVMYPYRTKIDRENYGKNKEAEIIEWSNKELQRVLGYELNELSKSIKKLNIVQGYKEENEYRKILKEREMNELKDNIKHFNELIHSRLKNSLYAIRAHEAGYNVNVDQSININWKKCEALAQ